ncbi:MAG: hypothetical protein HY902_07690 [Deltaproteobacteria bacterium]|nr:hypothetical protein [Deltaproteobacteria bacterium]
MTPARLVPLLLMGAGALTAVKRGPAVADHLFDAVKVALTRYELSQLVKGYQLDAAVSTAPAPENPQGFRNWAAETLRTSAARDATLDLWGQPWRFERDGRQVVFKSTGPNTAPDACADGAAPAEAAPDGEPLPPDDDICEWVDAAR